MCKSDIKSVSQTPHKHWVAILITLFCVFLPQLECGFLASFQRLLHKKLDEGEGGGGLKVPPDPLVVLDGTFIAIISFQS